MKDGYPHEETSAEERRREYAPLDEVDYKSLSYLIERSPAPAPSAAGLPHAPTTDAKKSGLSTGIIAAIIVGFLLIATGGSLYFLMRTLSTGGTKQGGISDGGDKASPSNDGGGTSTAKAELIAIPGGSFQMGRSDGMLPESPPHAITVKPFSMDKTEVTNAEYAQFVKETGYPAPSHFVNGRPLARQENWPVVNVSIEDAKKFAEWRSKRDGVQYRLPTEEEWEYAARNGDQNTLYPWGSSWEENRAATRESSPASLRPVGSMPDGKNRWGVLDLIGNVWEWTDSKASYYPGSKGQVNPQHKDWHILRGGGILSESKGERPISSTYRDWVDPSVKNPYLGFRLVRPGDK